MEYQLLRTELGTDSVGLGYAGKTDQQAADLLNATNTGRTLPRTMVRKSEIFQAIVNSEWPTTAVLQNKLLILFSQDSVNAADPNTQAIIGSIFGPGTQTRANLLALAQQTVSRAVELGLGPVTGVDVGLARSGQW
jgi:hypothetical protein